MRPSARLQSAIELLDEIIIAARDNGPSADNLATRFFAARRYAGSKDRRAIRDMAWAAIRRFGARPETGRSAFVTMADGDAELAALFDGSAYGPAAILPGEPRVVEGVIHAWVQAEFDPLMDEDEQMALLERAPIDLRVNMLKSDRESVLAQLPDAEILPQCPWALRLPTGERVEQHPVMQDGLVEIQDLGSQLISMACGATPGQLVVDLCAGAGGKSLALSAAMGGEGQIVASDTNRSRLSQLPPRAERAGGTNIETLLLDPGKEAEMLSPWDAKADLVLIDAPCSGSGTWRRNPETRWRITEERVRRVMAEQARLLSIGAKLVAPGGYMVYAVCSLLRGEGRMQIADFLSSHDGWVPVDTGIGAGRQSGNGILLTPLHDGSDGFFLARMQKL